MYLCFYPYIIVGPQTSPGTGLLGVQSVGAATKAVSNSAIWVCSSSVLIIYNHADL